MPFTFVTGYGKKEYAMRQTPQCKIANVAGQLFVPTFSPSQLADYYYQAIVIIIPTSR